MRAGCLPEAGRRGSLPGTGGNIAMRVGDHFAVTPSSADYYTMTPEDICILDLATLRPIESRRKPSVESGLHARLLRFAPISRHRFIRISPLPVLWPSSINRSMSKSNPNESCSERSFRSSPYGPSGTWFLARAFGNRLRRDANAYFLRNHGIVCGGATMESAMENVRLLERVSARFLRERIQSRPERARDRSLISNVLTDISST